MSGLHFTDPRLGPNIYNTSFTYRLFNFRPGDVLAEYIRPTTTGIAAALEPKKTPAPLSRQDPIDIEALQDQGNSAFV